MKKQYYVNYYRDFANTYSLYWAETDDQIKMAEENENNERITRKRAEQLCAAENERRKYNPNSSGYADNVILPIDYDYYDWENDPDVYKYGYIIDYVNK